MLANRLGPLLKLLPVRTLEFKRAGAVVHVDYQNQILDFVKAQLARVKIEIQDPALLHIVLWLVNNFVVLQHSVDQFNAACLPSSEEAWA